MGGILWACRKTSICSPASPLSWSACNCSLGSGNPPDSSFSRGSKSPPGGRALDLGCGALGWLRILSEWVGPSGDVTGTDIDERLLEAADSFLEAEGISNVELVVDDILDSKLEPQGFISSTPAT